MKHLNFMFSKKGQVNKVFFILLALCATSYSYSQSKTINVRVTDATTRFVEYEPTEVTNLNPSTGVDVNSSNFQIDYKSPADHRKEYQEQQMRDLQIERMRLENEQLRQQNNAAKSQTSTTKRNTATSQNTGSYKHTPTIKESIPLREKANVNSREIYQCPKGAKVEILDNSGSVYYKVRVNGYTGYVSKGYINN